ncbi:MAG: hypothetical protein Q8K78_14545, partial [Planctomycetaceae bacterium]|nr:hypothetical protein [Planctomycetaceae bacterium]
MRIGLTCVALTLAATMGSVTLQAADLATNQQVVMQASEPLAATATSFHRWYGGRGWGYGGGYYRSYWGGYRGYGY